MATIEDYLKINGGLSFDKSPLNEVDILVLTEFCYAFISKCPLFNEKTKNSFIKLNRFNDEYVLDCIEKKRSSIKKSFNEFLRDFVTCKRYQDLEIGWFYEDYSKRKETQFFAATFKLIETYLIVFRGTDNTIIGRKEDFNMSFMEKIPSQELAKNYSKKVMFHNKGNFMISGHSKGGNLSFYSFLNLPPRYQKRVTSCYNFDGPGFRNDNYDYSLYKDKMHKFVVEDDYIGVLMDDSYNFDIIPSTKINLKGHNALTWKLDKKENLNKFKKEKELTIYSDSFKKALNSWHKRYDNQDLEEVVSFIFDFITTDNISFMSSFAPSFFTKRELYMKKLDSLNEETKEKTSLILKDFGKTFLYYFLNERKNKKKEENES